jgi:hypothetical protein
MDTASGHIRDVMQVCRNGHVITDVLYTYPERGLGHCDRCGAGTLHRCPTCGLVLPGATHVPGMVPVGRLEPPQSCAGCGMAFPWANRTSSEPEPDPVALVETILRRLPRAVRQLRTRHGDRPPFRVVDEHDLEDLVRALLPLHFDTVRPETRTPRYALGTRTDFVIPSHALTVAAKWLPRAGGEPQLIEQFREDVAYYQRRAECRTLIGLVYDPEGLLPDPRQFEKVCAGLHEVLRIHAIVAT